MTKTTKIIIGVVVLGALVGGAFYVSKKLKDKREGRGLGADKDKTLLDTSGVTSGEYNPRNDSMFGKGLGVLLAPLTTPTAPTTPRTTPTIPRTNTASPLKPTTTTSSTPNFTQGIF